MNIKIIVKQKRNQKTGKKNNYNKLINRKKFNKKLKIILKINNPNN